MPGTVYEVGARLWLRNEMSGPLSQARSALDRLKKQSGPAGAAIRGMAADLVKAGAALVAFKLGLDKVNAGIEKAAQLTTQRMYLEIELSKRGADTAQRLETLKNLGDYMKIALEIQANVTGDAGDVLAAVIAGKKLAIPDTTLKSMLKSSAYIADLVGVEKEQALADIYTPAAMFGTKAENYPDVGTLLFQYSKMGKLGWSGLAYEMPRAGAGIQQAGGNIEQAMLLTSMVGKIKPREAGTAVDAWTREITRGDKKKKFEDLGFEHFRGGKLVSTEELQAQYRRIFGAMTPERRAAEMNELFGDIGKFVGVVLTGQEDAAAVRAAAHEKLTPAEAKEKQKVTLAYQRGSAQGTKETIVATAFGPLENLEARAYAQYNEVLGFINSKLADHPGLGKGISYGSAGILGALGLAGGIWAGRGLWRGITGIRAAGGIGGLMDRTGGVMAGVAKGEALKRAAGVQPVYVVNAREIGGGMGGPAATGYLAGEMMGRGMGRSIGRILRGLGIAGMVAGGTYMVYNYMTKDLREEAKRYEEKTADDKSPERREYDRQLVAESNRRKAERFGWDEIKSSINLRRGQARMTAATDAQLDRKPQYWNPVKVLDTSPELFWWAKQFNLVKPEPATDLQALADNYNPEKFAHLFEKQAIDLNIQLDVEGWSANCISPDPKVHLRTEVMLNKRGK